MIWGAEIRPMRQTIVLNRLERSVTDHAVWIVGSAVAVKLAFFFILAVNTQFVMDEFWQFGQSKYLGNGFFETIWPAKAVGYAVFFDLAHWIGWDATSALIAGRLTTAALSVATVGIVYKIARKLGHSRIEALLSVLLLLCMSTFIERAFRLRAERDPG